jgi:Zn-dependent protease/predicted transcriptional regulator
MKLPVVKIKGIPIKVHWSWFIAFGVISFSLSTSYFPSLTVAPIGSYFLDGILTTLFIFGSVLVHELGHVVYALKGGVEVEAIYLHVFGGIADLKEELKTPKKEFWMALAGPLTSFMLAGGFALFSNSVARYLSTVNLMIAVFNLLPIFPLDGGRLLKSLLWALKGNYIKATGLTIKVGQTLSILMISIGIIFVLLRAFGGGLWLIVIGGILRTYSASSDRVISGVNSGLKVKDIMIPAEAVITVYEDINVDNFLNEYFLRYGFHLYPVCNSDGKITGVVSSQSAVNNKEKSNTIKTASQVSCLKIKDIMTENFKSISLDATVEESLKQMLLFNVDRLLVFNNGKFQGLLTKNSIARARYLQ